MCNMSVIKYPIWFCEVEGRILTPTKPRARQKSLPKPKTQIFKISMPVKFYPFSEDEDPKPIISSCISLQRHYKVASNAEVIFDKIILISACGETTIKR
jgi:hypothetical protein